MSQLLRFKFWILIGVLVIAAIVAYVVGYRSLAAGNDEALDQIQAKLSSMRSVQAQEIVGADWRDDIERLQNDYQRQQETVQSLVQRGLPDIIVGEVTDWRLLCLKLAGRAEDAPAARHLGSLMVAPVRESVQRMAAEIVDARQETGVGLGAGRTYPAVQPPLKMRLLREINNLLRRPDFYDEEAWGELPLLRGDAEQLRALAATLVSTAGEPATEEEQAAREKEIGEKVLELEQKRDRIQYLLERRGQLSDADLAWLNRLLLEAAMPEHIRDSSIRRKYQAPFQYLTVVQPNLYQYIGIWKGVYGTRVNGLRNVMQDNFLGYGENCLAVANYSDEYVPVETEMQWQEEAYWIQRYIVRALGRLNDVPRISPVMTEEEQLSIRRQRLEEDRYVVPLVRSIRFAYQPERLLHYSHGESFRPLALDVTVIMRGRYLSLVQKALIEHVPTLEVTGYSVNRYGEAPANISRVRPGRASTPREPRFLGDGEDVEDEYDRRFGSEQDRRERDTGGTMARTRISGFRVYPYDETVPLPEDVGFNLQGKLVEVTIRCYVKEGEPGGVLFDPAERTREEMMEEGLMEERGFRRP